MRQNIFIIISILVIFTFESEIAGQDNKTVNGIVTAFKQIPLKKVKVTASKSGLVAFTDSIGRFNIKCPEKDVLIFTATGFGIRKIKVGKENSLVVDLLYKDDVNNFNGAVSNGHITEEILRKSIEAQQLKNVKDYSKYNSIFELISSEIYNVSVRGTSVYNKKIKSMERNPQVLYVVDDKIVPDISYINPTYVKSIEFVDDVGTTMYGSMGANGVLKIYLK